MKRIHIGHHFFGSGNLGDDFVLSALLSALKDKAVRYSCCVPYDLATLKLRYPQIEWKPYTHESRSEAIQGCDLWLGLGGSPFQSEVSNWFIKHLSDEATLCSRFNKEMFFLGIGGQDAKAYTNEDIGQIMSRASAIWTRDDATYEALQKKKANVFLGADLSHALFDECLPPAATPGRLTAALNFDYKQWSNLPDLIQTLEALSPKERVWMIQESRDIPGAEKALFKLLPDKLQALWKQRLSDQPAQAIRQVIAAWPSGEWLLSSRYHTTLASAWSGSKAVVIETNLKLKSAALECGYSSLSSDATPEEVLNALLKAEAPSIQRLKERALLARAAIHQFCALAEIT